MRIATLCAIVLTWAASAHAQVGPTPALSAQQLFEAGQYGPALQAIAQARQSAPPTPEQAFLAGQVYLRLNQNDNAKGEFARLVASDNPVWHLVGASAVALLDNHLDLALNEVTQAAALLPPDPPAPAHAVGTPPAIPRASEKFHVAYQMGLVKARREDWQGAADAFARAARINPTFAYAHYYAGLAYSRLKRPDQVALYFEHFLSVAPKAPERSAVMSIMRTIRGN